MTCRQAARRRPVDRLLVAMARASGVRLPFFQPGEKLQLEMRVSERGEREAGERHPFIAVRISTCRRSQTSLTHLHFTTRASEKQNKCGIPMQQENPLVPPTSRRSSCHRNDWAKFRAARMKIMGAFRLRGKKKR